ncbi:MAG: dihydroorotate dehydrogenase electron transfer subunit [Anaerolineae bacterium]|nr:dihydroorotate dehydrogenase electron transfer subunit [Anaerolineae bacterium]
MHQVLKIKEIRVENYRTKTFIFGRPVSSQPGQFVMAWLPGIGEKPLSIAADFPFALTVVAVGPFSEALHRLQIGDRLWVRGPLGHGFRVAGQRLLLAGGGYGVAPLFFLARKAIAQGCTVELCAGARTAADILLAADFERAGAVVHIATEDGSLGHQGLVTAITENVINENRPDALYACGPVKMLEALEQQCQQYNLPHQLSWEAHMRCGLGICGACEVHSHRIPGWLACQDGPVSDSS